MKYVDWLFDAIKAVRSFLNWKNAKEEQKTAEELRKADAHINVEEGKKKRSDKHQDKVDEQWDILNEE